MDKPFWEQTYLDDNVSTFRSGPNPTIIEMMHLFDKEWNILDVGCGEGKNDIYLAMNGFKNIDAFDISEAGIAKLKRVSEKVNVSINAYVQDLCQYKFSKNYDLVMTHGTLHFVTKKDWYKFIYSAKEHTNPNGIHIVQIFTNNLPATTDIAPYVKGMADEGEIDKLYHDWEIIQTKSYTFDDEHPGVPKHKHASNKIVTRKPLK